MCHGTLLLKQNSGRKLQLLPKSVAVLKGSRFKTNRYKVHIFQEGHKFLQNLHSRFVLCRKGQIYDISQHFVAFSEYMNLSYEKLLFGGLLTK